MKRIVVFIGMLMIPHHLRAQTLPSPVGEYFLKGEMETAAGFKLDSSGQFQFFFSYGALDRQARGTWRLEGERLVLASEPKNIKDFQLIESKRSPVNHVTISLCDVPSGVANYFIATGIAGKRQASQAADDKGRIILPLDRIDSLVLRFDWCPEKVFRYTIDSPSHNHFVFRLLPSITDVVFDNYAFNITAEEITGTLPFFGEHICTFRRTSNDDHAP